MALATMFPAGAGTNRRRCRRVMIAEGLSSVTATGSLLPRTLGTCVSPHESEEGSRE